MSIEVSIVLPTMNEEKAIGDSIKSIKDALEKLGLKYEIIVVDKGEARTPLIAESLGAKVVRQVGSGYGDAYIEGFKHASGKYIVIGDPDGSYEFQELPKLLAPLLRGEADIVICSRTRGNIEKGAMPWLHRHIGNPLLTWILNLFFGVGISDAHCGFRAFTRDALERLALKCKGMEFASEMIIKSRLEGLRIVEVPITYKKRVGTSKLRSFKDGWRHLRLMLLYSPMYLFLLPGVFFLSVGSILMGYAYFSVPVRLHTMILGSMLVLLGFQVLGFGISAKVYAVNRGFEKPSKLTKFFMRYSVLEEGLVIGGLVTIIGVILGVYIFVQWRISGYKALFMVKEAILVLTLVVTGIQIVFFSFFISVYLLEGIENG